MTGADALPVATSDGGNLTRRRRRLFVVPVLAFTTATMVVLGAGSASAASDPDPVGNLLGTVHKTVHKVTKAAQPATTKPATKKSVTKKAAARPAAQHHAGSTSTSPKAAAPGVTDYARSSVGHLQLAGHDVLDLSKNSSSGTQDATSADASLLAIGGTEVIGSHAKSDGHTSAHGPVPGIPLCEPTGGALCLDLLYADSTASKSGTQSGASTSTGVADLCLGGNDTTGATCSGLHLGVAQGTSSLNRDSATGDSTAMSWTSLANLCLQPGAGGCSVSGNVLGSNGSADNKSGASRDSTIADLDLAGTPLGAPGDPVTIAVPTDCTDPSLLCVFLNRGDDGVTGSFTSTAQSVVNVIGLGDQAGLTLAETETAASVTDTSVVSPPATSTDNPPAQTTTTASVKSTPQQASSVTNGLLPNTGGVWSGLLGIGLLLVGAGAIALAWARRRTAVA